MNSLPTIEIVRGACGMTSTHMAAFAEIDADPWELLIVAVQGDTVVGTLQLSLLPGMSRRGARRAQVEGVRVKSSARSSGLGEELIVWAVNEAKVRGCVLVQLTTDKMRADAQRFYERLGFELTHLGYKMVLP